MSAESSGRWPAPDWPAATQWSVCVRSLTDDRVLLERHPDRVLRTASVGKVFLLLEVARQAVAGECDLGERVARLPEDGVADSGVWYLMDQAELPVGDLCTLVGAFSDNLATNVLVRRFGIQAVRAASTALGCTESALLDRVREERLPEHPPTLSLGTAAELSSVMARISRGEAVSEPASAMVWRWLAAGADLSMVAAAFGLDPLAHAEPDRGITLVNKTGTISTARIDIGCVTGPAGGLAYAVGANWDADAADDPRDQVLATMREIGAELRRRVGG